jgi:hypothetical protein
MTVVALDANADGWPDIYVAADSTAPILYRNNDDKLTTAYGVLDPVSDLSHGPR